jgi:quaternary ammonium compound-resistance protein SugE
MAWMELIIAGILEVFWSTMMKWSDGFLKSIILFTQ